MRLNSHTLLQFLSLIILTASSSFINAQSPYFRKHTLPPEYRNTTVQIVLQDEDRFLWLGTTNGLVRFDGIDYKHFLQEGTEINAITALFEDRSGVLWIGSKNGNISKFDDQKYLPFEPLGRLPKVAITGFAQDQNGNVWIATYGEGLYALVENTLHSFSIDDGLTDNYIYTVASDLSGAIWAGTDRGISICNYENSQKTIRSIDSDSGLPDNIVTALKCASNGTMWIGLESSGICSHDPKTNSITHLTDNWKYGTVTEMLILPETLWAGTQQHGLIELSEDGSNLYLLQVPERKSSIESMALDTEGNIWIAEGSSRMFSANRTFTSISTIDAELFVDVQALLYTRDGSILFSSPKGLFAVNLQLDGVTKIEDLSDQLPVKRASVISLYEDFQENVWAGTFDNGVFQLDFKNKKAAHFSEKNGLINNNVLSIAGTRSEIWLATLGGVSKINLGKNGKGKIDFENFTSENGLGSNYIYKIHIDRRGRVWFATDGKGVTVLDQGHFRNFSLNNGLKSDVVYSVTEDADSNIWISTSNTGLYKFAENKFQSFTPHNGLRDLSIASIVGDRNGNILIASKDGIDVLNPSNGMIYYHGTELGINEINPNLNAYTIDSNENILFGTQKGIIRYSPTISPPLTWPDTHIHQILLFLRTPDQDQEDNFSHDENHISFDYMGFWYHDPEEVTYQLKLEGHDREWINSKNRFTTYPNLPPGNYTFNVRSSATNHFNGAPIKKYSFVIHKPFYNTVVFYILSTLLLCGTLFWFIQRREKKIKRFQRQEKEKMEFQFETLKNQINPHFLFNSFNALIGVIEEDKETAIEYVEKLSDFYRNLLLHREKELITLAEELELLDQYYYLQVKRHKNNFRLSRTIDPSYLTLRLPPLTLQLLVENALKHNIVSHAKPLLIDILTDGDYLVVINNLQRKLYTEQSTRLGLHNIVNRYQLLTDDKVRIIETVTHFRVEVPLLKR